MRSSSPASVAPKTKREVPARLTPSPRNEHPRRDILRMRESINRIAATKAATTAVLKKTAEIARKDHPPAVRVKEKNDADEHRNILSTKEIKQLLCATPIDSTNVVAITTKRTKGGHERVTKKGQ